MGSNIAGRVLTELCSNVQYILNRDPEDIEPITGLLTRVRYTPAQDGPIDFFDVISGNRIIRITSEDVGEHLHECDSYGRCHFCSHYDVALDQS